jgi:ATPase subunit of ABC transporter with duplicated ATPase domains
VNLLTSPTSFFVYGTRPVIVASGIAMQFGAKPLFSDVSVKFGGGNRYRLISANGCGKSTFMKILGREFEPSAKSVAIESN